VSDELKSAWEEAEKEAVDLSNEYTERRQALKEEFEGDLQEATNRAVLAQKAYLDAVVAEQLADRDDGEVMARVYAAQGDPGPANVLGIDVG
jgi:predicted transcriptional regulator